MIGNFSGGYRWLSNFYPVVVLLDGESYVTVEHAYQAAKSLDEDERTLIRRMSTPGGAKRVGKILTIRSDWQQLRLSIMNSLLLQKFSHPRLKTSLRETAPHELVEGNTWGDTFWGVCDGAGENHLGRLLMEIRDKAP